MISDTPAPKLADAVAGATNGTEVASASRARSLRHFLDSRQYTTPGLLQYERVYGRGFTSSGGEATARELTALLRLQPGERVLDVGSGIGGSTRLISEVGGRQALQGLL